MLIKKEGLCNFHNDFAKKRKTIEKIHNIKKRNKIRKCFYFNFIELFKKYNIKA